MRTDDEKIRQSLKFSILDGSFSASMIGLGESFFVAYAIFLKATNIQIGLLSSLPQAVGSLMQFFSNRLIWFFRSRKRLVVVSALLQAVMYIPITLVFFSGTFRVYHLTLFICIYWIFGMMLGPAWNSWMGDLTDVKDRGVYFGRRSKITGFATFVTFMLAGYILQRFRGDAITQYAGFSVIFILAFIARIASFVFLSKKYEPPYEDSPESDFGFMDFVIQARFTNYGLFVLYLSLMHFSVSVSAPFFTPYMLRDLKLDYMTYTLILAVAIIAKLFSFPVWGRTADVFGSKKVLSLTGFLMPLIPLLWLVSRNPLYLIVVQLYSGFIWGGFEISSFNFIFDTTTPQKRATCVAYYNMINGIALFSGALLGSLMVKYNAVFWSKYLLVFLISCILRLCASFLFIPRIREVREVEAIPYPHLFLKVVSTMPTMGLIYQLIPFKRNRK